MPTLEQIEQQVKQLTRDEQEALRDWLENVLEDELEMTDDFKAKIAQGEDDLREGRIGHRREVYRDE
jgi:molecular chaperone GrpE (heat shock protein)